MVSSLIKTERQRLSNNFNTNRASSLSGQPVDSSKGDAELARFLFAAGVTSENNSASKLAGGVPAH